MDLDVSHARESHEIREKYMFVLFVLETQKQS